jgi:hypothetical protein
MEIDALLCDYAQVAGGKLFIAGANIDRSFFPAGAQPPFLPTFAVAGVVHVPWTETNKQHVLNFDLIDADGSPVRIPAEVNPDQPVVRGEMPFNVGRPPILESGDEQMVPFAFNFQALPISNMGKITIKLNVDGADYKTLNFSIVVEPSHGFGG